MLQEQTNFTTLFNEFSAARQVPAWLASVREKSFKHFEDRGLPTRKNEDWRYTNVAPLGGLMLSVPQETEISLQALDAQTRLFVEKFKNRIVFVDGSFSKSLSQLSQLEAGLSVQSLADELGRDEALFKKYFASETEKGVFENLNAAFLSSGTLITVAAGKEIKEPLHVVYLATQNDSHAYLSPRTLIVLEKQSSLSILESYFSFSNNEYFTNAVTDIVLEDGARLNRVKLQAESINAYHVGNTSVVQHRDSQLNDFSFTTGARLCRNDLSVRLQGQGALVNLDGLYAAKGKQHIDNHTAVDHAVPHTTSRQLYKGILDEEAHAVFNGRVVVDQDAQKTDSMQLNKNLLLSRKAQVDTKPQLEIAANDVACTHGATVGQISSDEVFYIQSRGVPKEQANTMLMQAYADDVLDRIANEPIRIVLKDCLRERYFAE